MDTFVIVHAVTGAIVDLEDDWSAQAQRAAEDHLTRVWTAFYEEKDDFSEMLPSPSMGLFCGCQTCEVRETLYAALPFIEAGVLRDEVEHLTDIPEEQPLSETTGLLEQRCDDAKALAAHDAHEWTVSTLTYWCPGYRKPPIVQPAQNGARRCPTR